MSLHRGESRAGELKLQRAANAAKRVSKASETKLATRKARKAASSPSALPAKIFLLFKSLRMQHHVKGVSVRNKRCAAARCSAYARKWLSGKIPRGRSNQALRLCRSTSHQIAMTGENTSSRTASMVRRAVRSTRRTAIASLPEVCCSTNKEVLDGILTTGWAAGPVDVSLRADGAELIVSVIVLKRIAFGDPAREPMLRTAEALTKRAAAPPSCVRPATPRSRKSCCSVEPGPFIVRNPPEDKNDRRLYMRGDQLCAF